MAYLEELSDWRGQKKKHVVFDLIFVGGGGEGVGCRGREEVAKTNLKIVFLSPHDVFIFEFWFFFLPTMTKNNATQGLSFSE